MSKFVPIETKFRYAQILCEALTEVSNYKPTYSETPVHLYGYEGRQRPEVANIVVPRKQIGRAANDIGFCLQEDGTFKAIISQYDRCKHDDAWMAKLNEAYGIRVALAEARRLGYQTNLVKATQKGGKTRLEIYA